MSHRPSFALLACALAPCLLLACTGEPSVASTDSADQATSTAETDAVTVANGQAALQAAIAGAWRSPEDVARDPSRHPLETLEFFGLQPAQTVVEITPGAGWYAQILAPYLHEDGNYVAAVVDPAAVPEGPG